MKIATYNIWNNETNLLVRKPHILREIMECDADVIALQEVRDKVLAQELARNANYPTCYCQCFPDEEECLCIMSRLPVAASGSWMEECNAIYAVFQAEEKFFSIINAHLPWDSAAEREKQIVAIIAHAEQLSEGNIYLLGDFNCSPTSDVQRFLMGECLLNHKEAKPRWYDLAVSFAERKEMQPYATLDFRKNPNLKGNSIENSERFDRILIRNPYPRKFPELIRVTLFGQHMDEESGLCASDHYGVLAELK
ncbi:MAG: endonuclease/exonuclease/phosphatase family protein [Clostridia bacterium]|nr:endonuclease/exonuclease/phosphatase family protein [Clostridia bacterium]